jgi:hypothetical protein
LTKAIVLERAIAFVVRYDPGILRSGDRLSYQYMPSFNLIDADSAAVLLQVLKAIRDWEPN